MSRLFLSILIVFLINPLVNASSLSVSLDGKGVNGSLFVNAVSDTTVPELSATKFYLQKNGTNVAYAYALTKQVNTHSARWLSMSGSHINQWSDVLTEVTPVPFKLIIEFKDGSTLTSNTFNIHYQTQFTSDYSFDINFPQTGPDVPVTLTSSVAGASGNQSYKWMQSIDWMTGVNSSAQILNGETNSFISMTLAGGVYAAYGWGIVPLILQVEDGNNISFTQKFAYIDKPYEYGNPNKFAVPNVNSVALTNGQLFLSAVDMQVSSRGLDFILGRSLNSNLTGEWRFNLEQKVTFNSNKIFTHIAGDGSYNRYFLGEDGLWHSLGRSFDILRKDNSSSGYNIYTKSGLIYRFESPAIGGKLLSIADRDGNALTLSYTNDMVSQVTDSQGRVYHIEHNASGKITKVTDFTGRFVEYSWIDINSWSYISSFKDVLGRVTQYSGYGTDTFVITDPKGEIHQYGFSTVDQIERVSRYTSPTGAVTAYSYTDSTSNLVVASASVLMPGETKAQVYQFDLRGRLTSITDENSNSSTKKSVVPTSYDKIAELILPSVLKNARGVTEGFQTSISYGNDGRGNPIETTNPLNQTTTNSWQSLVRPSDQHLTNLNVITSYQPPGIGSASYTLNYNSTGSLVSTTNPLNQTIEHTYNHFGQKLTTKMPLQNTTRYSYDANHNLIKITDSNGQTTEYTYDALGRTLSQTDKRGFTTSYTYDVAGQLLTETDPLGNVTSYTYDANGNRETIKDPRGNTQTLTYTANNQLASTSITVDGTIYTTHYIYDIKGRVIQTINRNGQSASTAYDAVGHVLNQTDELNNRISYTYDKNGNVLTVTNSEGQVFTKTYDVLDRILTETDHLGNSIHYVYNAQGLVSQLTDPRGIVTTYGYDNLGQMTSVTVGGGTTVSTYDANGNLKTVTDPKGQVTTYTYDALDRRIKTADDLGNIWQYSYDIDGYLLIEILPDGQRIEQDYNPSGFVIKRSEYTANGTLMRSLRFTYDANGNRTSISDGVTTKSYSYDEINRLKTATDHYGNTIIYQYDGVGNLTELTYPGNKQVNYSYDATNRLSSVTDWLGQVTRYTRNDNGQITTANLGNGTQIVQSFDNTGRLTALINRTSSNQIISSHQLTLDENGNIIKDNVTQPLLPTLTSKTDNFSYGAGNRLTSNNQYTFSHDDNGRIVQKGATGDSTVYQFNIHDLITNITLEGNTIAQYQYDTDNQRISSVLNGTETRYVVDSNAPLPRVIATTNAAGEIQQYYIYGEGLLNQIDAQGGSHFYHFDPTGNTLALTDASQAITDRYAYTPYGETTQEGTTTNPFLFNGKWGVMDDGNGLVYMRARYYNQDTKRFMSLDALMGDMTDPMTLNRYAYVKGNPIMNVDPSGKFAEYGTWTYSFFSFTRESDFMPMKQARIISKALIGNIKESGIAFGEDINSAIDSGEYGLVPWSLLVNVGGGMLDSLNPMVYAKYGINASIDELRGVSAELKKDLKYVNSIVFMTLSIRGILKKTTNAAKGFKQAKAKMSEAKRVIRNLYAKHGSLATSKYKGIFTIWVNKISKASKNLEKSTDILLTVGIDITELKLSMDKLVVELKGL